MPLLLAALVFRVLVPPGFMMGGAGSTTLQATMCATTPGLSETIEVPGSGQPHCEYCVAPALGAPLALSGNGTAPRAGAQVCTAEVPQLAVLALLRSQSARAPPRA
jgi:hypothetical protein